MNSMKVYQPKTEMFLDDDGTLVIAQELPTGDEYEITIDKNFIPAFLEWLGNAMHEQVENEGSEVA